MCRLHICVEKKLKYLPTMQFRICVSFTPDTSWSLIPTQTGLFLVHTCLATDQKQYSLIIYRFPPVFLLGFEYKLPSSYAFPRTG